MYDFRNMGELDVFQAKLKYEVIPFGFIPVWQMKSFLNFCIKYKLLHKPPTYREHAYLVEHKFSYGFTGSKVHHLPFGWILEWIADIFCDSRYVAPLRGYVQRYMMLVEPRGTKEGFTYVTWYNRLIR